MNQENSESTVQSTPSASPTLGEMSFSEYEAARRSGVKSDAPSAPEAKSPEQKKASVSETEGSDDKELSDESDAEESEEGLEAKDAESEKPKKKGGFQKRIDKLNSRVTEKEREIEFLRSQLAKAPSEPKEKQAESKQASADGKPNPDDFDTHAEWAEALTDWKLEQRDAKKAEETKKESLKAEQDNLIKTHTDRVNAFKAKHDDFMDVIDNVAEIPMSVALQELIISSEQGPALMYELAKNPEEFERISKLSPLAAAREIGKLESRVSEPSPKSEPKKLTTAPKPIDPVGKSTATSRKSLDDPSLPYSEYERMRREQIKKRGR